MDFSIQNKRLSKMPDTFIASQFLLLHLRESAPKPEISYEPRHNMGNGLLGWMGIWMFISSVLNVSAPCPGCHLQMRLPIR
jgi:hypothetical protein